MKQLLKQTGGFSRKQKQVMLKKIFSNKVGREKGITLMELMNKIYSSSDLGNVFKKAYYRTELNQLCMKLRKETDHFIVTENLNGTKWYYILKTKQELKTYKTHAKKQRDGILQMEKKAVRHVTQKKWRNI